MKTFLILIFFSLSIVLFSCKKDENEASKSGTIQLHVKSMWQNNGEKSPFLLSTNFVQEITGDTLNFDVFSYYLSNVKFRKKDGTWWSQPNSYFLIQSENDENLSISGVPIGEYTALQFTLGVDSTKNVSGAQTGDLSPAFGMFWSWNTGYIFIKAEGTSPNIEATNQSFAFHLAGFTGQYAIVTNKTFEFTDVNLVVSETKKPTIHIENQVNALWNSAQSVNLSSNIQATSSKSKAMALDFYNSFVFTGIVE